MAGPKKASQRGPRPASQRGDFTGNKKAALLKEHEEQVDSRREELGIVSERQASIRDEGTIDLMSGKPLLEHPDVHEDQQVEVVTSKAPGSVPDVAEPSPMPAPQGERIGTGTTSIDVFELPEERTQIAGQKEALTAETQNEPTLVKCLYDMEDVTIGYGNTFNFKADYRYRVPRWVAAHLEEKGLAIVLSLNPV